MSFAKEKEPVPGHHETQFHLLPNERSRPLPPHPQSRPKSREASGNHGFTRIESETCERDFRGIPGFVSIQVRTKIGKNTRIYNFVFAIFIVMSTNTQRIIRTSTSGSGEKELQPDRSTSNSGFSSCGGPLWEGGASSAGILHLQVPCTCNKRRRHRFSSVWVDFLVDFFASTVASTARSAERRKNEKGSTTVRLSSLFFSRGDWIRTSDHTPPRVEILFCR